MYTFTDRCLSLCALLIHYCLQYNNEHIINFSGGNIANIASLRPKKSTNAATALVQVLQGKGSVCHLMTKDERDNLARNIQKLLRATYASADPEGLMSKLRSALDGLVALALVTSDVSNKEVVGLKRSVGDRETEEEGEGERQRQQ